MGRPTYDEVVRENKVLRAKLEELQRAMKEANRSIVRCRYSEYVAVPLRPEQETLVLERLKSSRFGICPPCEGKHLHTYEDGVERWEGFVDDDDNILPGINCYVVHYSYTREDGMFDFKIWAAIPY